MMTKSEWFRAVPVVLLIGMTLGCTSASPLPVEPSTSVAPMWREQIDQILADPETSDFERTVFADYVVTDAEYHEAQSKFADCMADQGWKVEFGESGYDYNVFALPGSSNVGTFVPQETTLQY